MEVWAQEDQSNMAFPSQEHYRRRAPYGYGFCYELR